MKDIKKFIKDFKNFGTGKEIIDCFSNGYCYWFAYILKTRFPNGKIYYVPVDNHFIFSYENSLFDITGDCSVNYLDKLIYSWEYYQYQESGSNHLNKLKNDCILKI